ncbi:MAG: hypothetical protein ACP5RH_06815 [Leptodesmis sp.]
MDGGYAGSDLVLWVMQTSHWFLRVVRRPGAMGILAGARAALGAAGRRYL